MKKGKDPFGPSPHHDNLSRYFLFEDEDVEDSEESQGRRKSDRVRNAGGEFETFRRLQNVGRTDRTHEGGR